jgi:hypothetical protein
MKKRSERDIILFEEMTLAALDQENGAAFIQCLLDREKVSARLAAFSPELDGDVAGRFYVNEVQVIERLKKERTKLMMEIDRYSQNRRAMRSYSPTFPFPPAPSFFSLKK